MFKNKNQIIQWLEKNNVSYYSIRDDLTVDVYADVNLSNKLLYDIPIKFGIIDGNFWCASNGLISLDFSPSEVRGDFDISNNKISSLKDCPKLIEGNFNCAGNPINTINDLDSKILGNFYHRYQPNQYSKIIELAVYYKNSTAMPNAQELRIPGKELENVVCEKYLQGILPTKHTGNHKKLKV
jgi:hypothetical protein